MNMKRLLLSLGLCCACAAAQDLTVYAIDVEGGKSTLYVSPSGQSMLVDAGYGGFEDRDALRISAAARAAGVKQIDYLVITHYHADHVGGVAQLAAMMPIRRFIDHGKNFETEKENAAVAYDAYLAARKHGEHSVVQAGDRIPIAGLDVQVVTASGEPIRRPLPGAGQSNPLCAAWQPIKPDTGENAHSIGMVITVGKFRLLDLGDLYWNQEHDLACPNNLLGRFDVFMTTHHAKKTSDAPAIVQALGFQAAIMNNGPLTGGVESSWQAIHDAPGTPDIWQLHYAQGNDAAHNAPERFIANTGEKCRGNWIRLVAHPDGSFEIRNGANQFEKSYPARTSSHTLDQ
jgi:beta-lactamase superfamily II metal-dependent hydrolase